MAALNKTLMVLRAAPRRWPGGVNGCARRVKRMTTHHIPTRSGGALRQAQDELVKALRGASTGSA